VAVVTRHRGKRWKKLNRNADFQLSVAILVKSAHIGLSPLKETKTMQGSALFPKAFFT